MNAKLKSCSEQIQDNILIILDGYPDEILDVLCDMVVKEFHKLEKEN